MQYLILAAIAVVAVILALNSIQQHQHLHKFTCEAGTYHTHPQMFGFRHECRHPGPDGVVH